ncbi:MAG: stage II sporulation protein M [Bacillota bacterium]|nr:stage II sporulation protein M [Bacillota bacterium]MDW7684063.1 stage II sporulation protein M [Bacillota bacterium]
MWKNFKYGASGHFREQFGLYLLVFFILLAGIVAGAFSVRMMEESQLNEINTYFYSFIDGLTEQQPVNTSLILQRSLLQNGSFILALWLCGTVFIGFIPALCLVFYRGYTIGFTVGFLAGQNMGGILFSLGAVFPQNIIYVPVTILAGVLAVSFSLMLLKRRVKGKLIPFGAYLFQYTLAMLMVVFLFAAGSLVETTITPVFMRAVVSLL